MTETIAPYPTHRLIPSQFPPIGLFDTVATAADLKAVMDLAGWTNDRLVAQRVNRLQQSEWVFGRPNASIVMAAFLHAGQEGSRFSGPELGAWYAATTTATALIEVAHHLRRETVARKLPEMRRAFRSYSARLGGRFRDVRGEQSVLVGIYDPQSYEAGQRFGEALRAAGSDGILYDSVRHRGGTNLCAYRPNKVLEFTQAEHFDVRVSATEKRIEARRLSSEA